jgi:hypothetical protein
MTGSAAYVDEGSDVRQLPVLALLPDFADDPGLAHAVQLADHELYGSGAADIVGTMEVPAHAAAWQQEDEHMIQAGEPGIDQPPPAHVQTQPAAGGAAVGSDHSAAATIPVQLAPPAAAAPGQAFSGLSPFSTSEPCLSLDLPEELANMPPGITAGQVLWRCCCQVLLCFCVHSEQVDGHDEQRAVALARLHVQDMHVYCACLLDTCSRARVLDHAGHVSHVSIAMHSSQREALYRAAPTNDRRGRENNLRMAAAMPDGNRLLDNNTEDLDALLEAVQQDFGMFGDVQIRRSAVQQDKTFGAWWRAVLNSGSRWREFGEGIWHSTGLPLAVMQGFVRRQADIHVSAAGVQDAVCCCCLCKCCCCCYCGCCCDSW